MLSGLILVLSQDGSRNLYCSQQSSAGFGFGYAHGGGGRYHSGGYPDIATAAARMGGLKELVYKPISENVQIYNELYAEYKLLYNYFGRGENNVMKRLRNIRRKDIAAQSNQAQQQSGQTLEKSF